MFLIVDLLCFKRREKQYIIYIIPVVLRNIARYVTSMCASNGYVDLWN